MIPADDGVFRDLIRKSQAVNFAYAPDGSVLLSEGRGLEALGIQGGELVGKDIFRAFADYPDVVDMLRRALEGREIRQNTVIAGITFDNLITPVLTAEGQVTYVIGVCTDITSRVNDSRKLEESERQFRSIIESSPMGVHMYEMNAEDQLIFIGANPAAEAILGMPMGDRIGLTIDEAFPPLAETEVPDRYLRAARDGEYWTTENIVYSDGKISGAFDVHAFQIRPRAMAVFFLDISERIRDRENIHRLNENLEEMVAERTRELEDARDELVAAEKMSALGRLVAGVAHEINTPVGVAKTGISYIEELVRRLSDQFSSNSLSESMFLESLAAIGETAASCHRSIDRSAELIRSFKMVAVDQSREEVREYQVSGYVTEILTSLYNQTKPCIQDIRIECPEGLVIRSDPGALFQIVTNLVMNTVSHGLNQSGASTIAMSFGLSDSRLQFAYRDNGPGLTPIGRERIFEPFYTTSRESGGTGLGMHIVYNTVTQGLRGTIRCPDSAGTGFLCEIDFPVEAPDR